MDAFGDEGPAIDYHDRPRERYDGRPSHPEMVDRRWGACRRKQRMQQPRARKVQAQHDLAGVRSRRCEQQGETELCQVRRSLHNWRNCTGTEAPK
jgi:hypothetical protein